MKKLLVLYNGWGERWPLGTMADTGQALFFEYSTQALERGLELSPLHHPLPRAGATPVAFKGERAFSGLPGFIADALPDGWGMLLMDRALRRQGRDPRTVSVLERLAMVGERAVGALSFEPALDETPPEETLALKALAEEVAKALENEVEQGQPDNTSPLAEGCTGLPADDKLRQLLQLGGSPQGARPKVLVNFDAHTGLVTSGAALNGSARPWLIKFPAEREHREVSALEELYARVARRGGLDMPPSRFFDLGAPHSAFGVERFDRHVIQKPTGTVQRVPLLSLSALVQADFRLPSLDYETVLLATQRLTGDRREVFKAFERCVFNVLLHNRDDHGRNFAYRLDAQGLWKLSPAFDLTFSHGPGGEHSTSVAGHGKAVTRTHLMQVAKLGGVDAKQAGACIDYWVNEVSHLSRNIQGQIQDLPIRKSTAQTLAQTLITLCDAVKPN